MLTNITKYGPDVVIMCWDSLDMKVGWFLVSRYHQCPKELTLKLIRASQTVCRGRHNEGRLCIQSYEFGQNADKGKGVQNADFLVDVI